MHGCENIALAPDSMRAYATDLAGGMHLPDGESRETLEIVSTYQLHEMCLGVVPVGPGELYVAASSEDWIETGGAIHRVDPQLRTAERATANYPGMNGIAADDDGRIYFATGDMRFMRPRGSLHLLSAPRGIAGDG